MTTTAFDASEKREVKEDDDTPRYSDLDEATDGLSGVMVASAEGATAVALDELGGSWTATLRGVPAYRLMSWMDNPFNRGHHTDRSLRKRYSNSVSVPRLDFFVSHSWNAPWWEKLLALCYLFNYQRASWSAIAAAIIEVSVVLYIYCNQSAPDTSLPTAHFLACISTSVFILLLLLPNFQLTRSSYKLFVDNCCIPQDDPVLKEVGIRSLGSYLSRSSSIVVMWSKCYFDRLWCVYELAAFLSLKAGALNGDRGPAERGSPVVEELRRVGRGIKEEDSGASPDLLLQVGAGVVAAFANFVGTKLVFGENLEFFESSWNGYSDWTPFLMADGWLEAAIGTRSSSSPFPLIKFVFAFTLVGFVGNILLSIEVAVVGSFKASLRARLICAIPEGLLLAGVLCPFASRYVRDRDALVNQIMTFQMENTKCTVEADREFVTGRISAMYNGDLSTFERVVKSEVGRAARQTLGIRRGTIPFKYVLGNGL
ncbi:hypothetical protein FOZ60_004664 [Perkinsus olseni]|uniref:Uncharacterized protein n=1 Tax=Perkinsus olseni TaxID=32597 RepID=A0A7J6NSS8_PEROL|nr:hypothetical protein FOZ60_004664 [Perkinsus olseni]